MKALSILDEVTQELEKNPNVLRIKRLILYICQETWENDTSRLGSMNLKDLIQELWIKSIKLEDIEYALNRLVSKVNKKVEYTQIAQEIIEQMAKLYVEPEESTEFVGGTTFTGDNRTVLYGTQLTQLTQDDPLRPSVSKPSRDPGDLFDVKQKILQTTNPLRAKIVLLSVLESDFSFSDRDWSLLKNHDLDSLLRRLYVLFHDFSDWEESLENVVDKLISIEGINQTAGAILEAISICYNLNSYPSKESFPAENSENYSNSQGQSIPVQPDEEPSYFRAGEITTMEVNNSFFDQDQIVQDFLNSPPPPTPYYPVEKDDEVTAAFGDSPDVSSSYSHSEVTASGVNSFSNAEVSLSHFKISESIKQKLSLEEQIKGLVSQSVDVVTESMEVTLKELENNLKKCLNQQNLEQRLTLKYRALRDFIKDVEKMTTQFMEVISEFEATEMKKLNPQVRPKPPDDEISGVLVSPVLAKNNQQKALELLKQGNPKAVASFFNQFLQPKGINILSTIKEGTLHIVVESAEIPPQAEVVSFISKKLQPFGPIAVKNIKIHGRVTGQKSLAWSKDLS